jgi:hypothetical protein
MSEIFLRLVMGIVLKLLTHATEQQIFLQMSSSYKTDASDV